MRRTNVWFTLAPVVVLLFCGGESRARNQEPEAKPLLKQSDRDALGLLFADYFEQKTDNKDLKKLLAALDKLEAEMKKKAQAAKVSTLFESPIDLRSAMCAPFTPDKNAKKGMWAENSTAVELASGETTVKFFYRLPKKYNEKQLYPLIVGLAPKADKPEAIKKWAEAAYPDAIAESAIIIVPQNTQGVDWTTLEGRLTALLPLRQSFVSYSVDRGRLFLDGQADATATVVHYISVYPAMFTAAILRESAAAPSIDLLANARYVPLLLVGAADTEAAKIHAQLYQDCTAVGLKATLSESAVEAGGKPGDAGATAIASFVAETRKNFAPRDIKFTSSSNDYPNAYGLWLSEVESNGKPVTVEATVDRTTNEFRISAPLQVKEITLYLNQDLVDMGKVIKVIVTEKVAENPKTSTQFEGRVNHSFEAALGMWFDIESSNTGEVYSNKIKVKMH